MLTKLKILLFGHQPFAKIDSETLNRLIVRDFGGRAGEVRQKLNAVTSNNSGVANLRASAAILKLANQDIRAIDGFIKMANNDPRDVIANAEYPRAFSLDFDQMESTNMKPIYLADWEEYSAWLNK
jgi:hypothetical protein